MMNISPWLGAAPAKPNQPTAHIRDVSGTDFTAASACFAMFLV